MMDSGQEIEHRTISRPAARRILGAGAIAGAFMLLGPMAYADEDCDPYIETCGTTTTTDRDNNTTTTGNIDGATTTITDTTGSTTVGRPGGSETTTTSSSTTTTLFERAEGGLPVTGGDVVGLAVLGVAAVGGGKLLVRWARQTG